MSSWTLRGAPTGDDAIREAEIWSALTRAIEDQQLMFNEEGLGHDGTDAVRTPKSGNSRDEVDEKDEEIAHFGMVPNKPRTHGIPGKLAIRHGQAGREPYDAESANGKIRLRTDRQNPSRIYAAIAQRSMTTPRWGATTDSLATQRY